MSSQQRDAILEDMGITQWVSRQLVSAVEIESGVPEACFGITVSGQTGSGWMWLLEVPLNEQDQALFTDIRRATGCIENSLLASMNTASGTDLKQVLRDELITRLVLIGSTEFQQQLAKRLEGLSVARINCPPLIELQHSASAKGKLWGEFKTLMN